MNASQCGRLGGRAGTGLGGQCLSSCSLEGGGLEDINPSLFLPQFPWVESGLVKMLVVRPLRVSGNTDA